MCHRLEPMTATIDPVSLMLFHTAGRLTPQVVPYPAQPLRAIRVKPALRDRFLPPECSQRANCRDRQAYPACTNHPVANTKRISRTRDPDDKSLDESGRVAGLKFRKTPVGGPSLRVLQGWVFPSPPVGYPEASKPLRSSY